VRLRYKHGDFSKIKTSYFDGYGRVQCALVCLLIMDPEWEHAYMCLKLQNFYPITNKPDHTEKKSLIQSSASQKASIFGSGQKM